jgi:hypothetical protein
VTTGGPRSEPGNTLVSTAVALRAGLSEATALTPAERALLCDWLDRITNE